MMVKRVTLAEALAHGIGRTIVESVGERGDEEQWTRFSDGSIIRLILIPEYEWSEVTIDPAYIRITLEIPESHDQATPSKEEL